MTTAAMPPAALAATPPHAADALSDAMDRIATDRGRALARLQASRARLSQQLLPPARAARAAGPRPGWTRRVRGWLKHLRHDLADQPVVMLALNAAQDWWDHNPWRATGETVADELHASLSPWVRRHPVAALSLAVGAGAAVAAAKPWRWPLVAEQWRPLPRRVGRWALALLAQVPLHTLVAGLAASVASASAAAGGPGVAAAENTTNAAASGSAADAAAAPGPVAAGAAATGAGPHP
jgi:hypothetical protein